MSGDLPVAKADPTSRPAPEPRTAFVTGGAGGIGRAICQALAGGGHRVAVGDLDIAGAKRVAAEIGGLAVTLDVTLAASVLAAVERTGRELGPVAKPRPHHVLRKSDRHRNICRLDP